MGRIIDFVRNNLFWILMVLAVIVMALIYVSVGRGLTRDVLKLREEGTKGLTELRGLAALDSIANPEMIKSAEAEVKDIESLGGQLLVMFSPRSGLFDRDFITLKDSKKITHEEMYDWWKGYGERTSALLKRAQAALNAPEQVAMFKRRPAEVVPNLPLVRTEQKKFWRLTYVVDALAHASPRERPLIERLNKIQLGANARKRHDWVRGTKVTLTLTMAYENVGLLVAALQNAPKPLIVNNVRVARTDPEKDGPEAKASQEPAIMVLLTCDIVEFLPAVQRVQFDGSAFAKVADVVKWVGQEERDLHAAARVLFEKIPPLGMRARFWLGQSFEISDGAAAAARDARVKEIDAKAADELAKKLKAATKDGKIAPARKKSIETAHAALVARRKVAAQRAYRRAKLDATVRSGGFALTYDHLRAIVPRKAYFIGLEPAKPAATGGKGGTSEDKDAKTGPSHVIVRAPQRSKYGAARWWLAARGDKTYKGKRTQVVGRVLGEAPEGAERARVYVDAKAPDAPVLIADKKSGEIALILAAEPGGDWRAYDVSTVDGKAVSLSDTAFRFAPVIQAVGPIVGGPRAPGGKAVTVLPLAALASAGQRTFKVPVSARGGGTMTVTAGLRK